MDQLTEDIWPLLLFGTQLTRSSQNDDPDGVIEAVPIDRWLARMGKAGFHRYVTKILPLEMKLDKALADQVSKGDASTLNQAFLRWQKRSFSLARKVPAEHLNWDGAPIPNFSGVPYDWDLWDSIAYRRLAKHMNFLTWEFDAAVRRGQARPGRQARVFIWVEVFRPGEFSWPHTHTGALCAGTYFARYRPGPNRSQPLTFEDPRGSYLPFGRHQRHEPSQGEVLLWPPWAMHSVSPNPSNVTNVFFHMLGWPKNGIRGFDWEEDPSSNIVLTRKMRITKAVNTSKVTAPTTTITMPQRPPSEEL